MKTWPFILLLLLLGCARSPISDLRSPASNELKLNPPLGGSAPKDVFYQGNAQPAVALPPPIVCIAGELPAESSNLNLWLVATASSPAGPFVVQPELLLTNHFEIPETNSAQFFQFYGLND